MQGRPAAGPDAGRAIGTLLVPALAAVPAILACAERAGEPYWWDEYFSLWASDPGIPFALAFQERIFPDSNPPLYFSLLYVARTILGHADAAILAINGAATLLAVCAVVAIGARSGRAVAAVLSVAVFLLGGPVLAQVDEARGYLLGLSIVLVATWLTAEAVEGDRAPPNVAVMAAVGLAAAMTHVYAALACAALAAGGGLATLGEARRRWPSLAALGAGATIATGIWFAINAGSAERVNWIQFNLEWSTASYRQVSALVFGTWLLAVPAVGGLALAAADPPRRRLASAMLVALIVFLTVPIAVSFVRPIITARYLALGSPIVIVGLALCAFPGPGRASGHRPASRLGTAARLLALVMLLASALAGASAAWIWREDIAFWHGGPPVAALVARATSAGLDPAVLCPAGSVATNGPLMAIHDDAWTYGLSHASGLPPETFAIVRPGQSPRPAPGCPVLGWIEHVWDGAAELPDAEVLRQLALPEGTRHGAILRTGHGYVIPAP